MSDFKRTSQYEVRCKGSSSQPFVEEPPRENKENPNYVDLHLAGAAVLSNNPEDYTAQYNGVELRVIKIEGKVLTVEFI